MEEIIKAYQSYLEFLTKLFDPATYLGKITQEEMMESLSRMYSGGFKALLLSLELWAEIMREPFDFDKAVKSYLNYISKLEDVAAEIADNPLYSAYVNAINRAYMRSLISIQNLNTAILHSLGFVSRKDIVALAESYVDLKGDIKRETKRLMEEIRRLREEIEEVKEVKAGKEVGGKGGKGRRKR